MAITSDPTYPIAGEIVSLAITGATGNTDATQFEITSVPDNSDLDTGMLVDSAGDAVQEFTPDAPGAYAITAYDYRRFEGGAAYAGDPAGEARDLLVATQTGTIYVGDVMDLPIRGAGHEVKLRLTVVDGTVRAAELVEPTTDVARYATLDTTVLAAVAALVGGAATSLGDSLITLAETYATEFNGHIDDASVHATLQDETNTLPGVKSGSLAGAIAYWHKVWDKTVAHMTTTWTGAEGWHPDPDFIHVPIAPKATDVAGAFVMMCDITRCYTDHVAYGSPIHDTVVNTYDLPAPATLTAAVQAVLDYFASETPTAPTGENAGAVRLKAKHGFVAAET